MALKIKLKQVAGTPTTSDLENGEIAHNTSANTLHIRIGNTIHSVSSSGGGGSVDLSAVDQDIIPDANNTRSLGSASKRFSDLFLSGQTINLGGATLSSDGTGTISISASGVTLPENSKAGTSKIAVANDEGVVVRKVDLFTAAGGLSTAATTFLFKATGSIGGVAGGASDAIQDGVSGYLCDGENLNSIYETIIKFYDNDNYKILGKNAYLFSKNFHWDKIIKKYIKLI